MRLMTLSLLLFAPIAACAHQPVAAPQIIGLEAYQARCPDSPAELTQEEALAWSHAAQAALAMPRETPAQRDAQAAALNDGALKPMTDRMVRLRQCELYERSRADGAVSLGARYNQAVTHH